MVTSKFIKGSDDLSEPFSIRKSVFVDEQKVPLELELDEMDKNSIHLVVYDAGIPIGTGRILKENGRTYIGRVAVLKEHRGQGFGDFIMRVLIRKIYDMGVKEQYIHAQVYAIGFYEKLGFESLGDTFMDAGIEHIEMVRSGDITGSCCG